ncbi:tol-pal system protein YbgF [Frigidibacter sp. MR17.24]|uniref:tol-pal system protein YbgF n=1 Tax=Frigidibacter sp. MR17.24 TaxID=3127345 RepID=UPI003012D1AA
MSRFPIRAALLAFATSTAMGAALAGPAGAETVADIRNELSQLAAQIQGLKQELTSNGASLQAAGGTGALDRMNTMEAELSRLTSATEELQNRVNRVVADGTNRIGDIEFRLCEMEDGCDVGNLPITASLGGSGGGGGGTAAMTAPAPAAAAPARAPAAAAGPELAMNEKADFDRAKGVLDSGDFRRAADQFAAFAQSYPGSPLMGDAQFLRGQALEQAGDTANAARAYLDGFSNAPEGTRAPENLTRLGMMLGQLGQVNEACVTLSEVGNRFPSAPQVSQARSAMGQLRCQ